MNWKGRQMFGGKPSGIVQMMGGGMTPYPTHVMPDGTVMPGATHGPGYEVGGLLPPLTGHSSGHSHPQLHAHQTGPQHFKKTPMELMEVGGVVPETKLFEEGDSDINSALNTMVGLTQPSVPDMPASNGMAMGGGDMMMDQGLESLDPSLKKIPFQKMAINIVEQADELLAQEDYANIEEIEQQVQEQLNNIDAQYRLQTGAEDTILTEEFLSVLDRITANSGTMSGEMPAYSHGGLHPTPEEQEMELYIRNLGGGTSANPKKMQEIIEKYRSKNAGSAEMLEKQIAKARRGALLGGKTKQSGLSGLFDVMGQADAAEVAALGNMPQQLSSNEAAIERLALENELAMYGGSKGTGMTATGKDFLLLQKILAMPDSDYKNKLLDRFNVDTEAKTIKEFVGDIAKDLGKLQSNELRKWKTANGFDGPEYETYTIPQLAVEQAKRLAAAMSAAASGSANTEDATTKPKNGNLGV